MRRETEIELSKSLVVAYAYLAETRSPVHAKLASYVDLIWASREIEMDKRQREREADAEWFRLPAKLRAEGYAVVCVNV